ncbi:MAG: D-alanyl-D-alanine carboxypeptidase family protein [Candidatus Binataceae bacterium]
MRDLAASHPLCFRAAAHCQVVVGITIAAALTLGGASDAFARRARQRTNAPASESAHSYQAAALLEPTSGKFIFEKNEHEPWPTASLTKMMVMLIVAEKLQHGGIKLTDQITTSRNASRMGGSQAYLKEGESFSLEDMMKALVVHSANDASAAIAEHIGGSTGGFVRMMNRRAQELGMKDTHYYSVHGLPPAPGDQQDVSSAYDCAILARELVKYPDIIRWSGIDTAPFRGGEFELRNTNHLVREYRGCDGLKTGFHAKAGFNVVATALRGGMRLIAVVLGSPRKRANFKAAAELMSIGFADYQMKQVAKKGDEAAASVKITGAAIDSLTPIYGGDIAVFTEHDAAKNSFKIEYKLPDSLIAPVKAGEQVGTAAVTMNGKQVASAPLVAATDVASRPSLLERLLGRR